MQHEGIYPDKITFSSALKACGNIEAIEHGRHIHEQAIGYGVQLDIIVANTLVDMYVKCHSLEEAHEVFLNLPNRDVVTWGSIIAAYAQHCDSILALKYLENMQQEGMKPAGATFLSIMKTCCMIGHLEQGRCVHVYIIGSGLRCDVIVGSTLVDMYAKCGSLEEACSNFARLPERNVVSWNAMIGAYAQDDEGLAALDCFHHMQHEGGKPDKVTFLCIFKACSSIKALECGRLIHEHVIQSGLHLDVLVGTALIDMYSKCNQLDEASKVFNELPNRNVISWGAIIDGYSQHDEGIVSLNYYNAMHHEGIKPDKVIFLCILKACGSIGAIEQGNRIHEQIVQSGIRSEAMVDNALINMYAKCGNMKDAQEIFKGIRRGDIVSWNTMVTGYAQIGEVGLAVQYFESMQYHAIAPDAVTFTAVLNACSHIGLVEEGYWYFTNMDYCFGVEPNLIHHNSIIDLLGSFGCFKMAEDALKSILQANISGLVALLAVCRTHNNVELGSRCFYEVVYNGPCVSLRGKNMDTQC